MKRNMIIFATVLVALIAVLVFVVNYQNTEKTEDNPYGKDNLHQKTIDQLDDPDYQNQIQPDDLEDQISSGEPTTVYFYDPICPHCQRVTPIVAPMAEKLGVDLVKMNLREFKNQGTKYGITATPTIVHFEDGEEVARIKGEQPVSSYDSFFHEEVLKDATEEAEG